MGRRTRLLTLAATIAALASPASAHATEYCVQLPGCGDVEYADLQDAFNDAQNDTTPPTVRVGPGDHTRSAGYRYEGIQPVEIIGAGAVGPNRTRIIPPDSAAGMVALRVTSGTGVSRVSNLAIQVPGESSPDANPFNIGFRGTADLNGLTVTISANEPGAANGVMVQGTMRDSTVDLGETTNPFIGAVRPLPNSAGATVEGSFLRAHSGGYSDGAPLTVRRTRIVPGKYGLWSFGGNITADSVQISLSAPDNALQAETIPTPAGNASILARNLTIHGSGSGTGTAANAYSGVSGRTASITVDSSILYRVANSFVTFDEGGGTATATVRYSNFTAGTIGPVAEGPGNTSHAEPGFRPEGDYLLSASSPLIDKGNPDAFAESPTTDLLGSPRLTDGDANCEVRRDMGAFEYQPPAPTDADCDNVPNSTDNCPSVSNGGQQNADGRGPGDACNTDADGDEVDDDGDNCQGVANQDQANFDSDAQGDACDTDDDNDGAPDTSDPAPLDALTPAPPAGDSDGDGIRDTVDTDDDNDGVPDATDPAPNDPKVPNPNTPTNGNDVINGTDAAETICGLLGNDVIEANGGNDIVFGDLCEVKARLAGAQAGAGGRDTINGGTGNDTVYGAGGDDKLTGGDGNDKVYGGAGNDSVSGGKGKDTVDGGKGNDKLTGGAGVNSYRGGAGDDSVNAKNGKRETIDCGSGKKDSVSVDRRDKVKGCEKVKRAKK